MVCRSFLLLALLGLLGCDSGANNPRVEMVTNKGPVTIELFESKAPGTVKNFLAYVDDKHFDGTIFHRVINGFMIQGGGFKPDMKAEVPSKAPIKNEATNGLKNDRGTLAMARTGDPHSATAQFFINVKDNDTLNHRSQTPEGWGYCVFGQVVGGMDVVDKIRRVSTTTKEGHADVPVDDVIIESIRRVPK